MLACHSVNHNEHTISSLPVAILLVKGINLSLVIFQPMVDTDDEIVYLVGTAKITLPLLYHDNVHNNTIKHYNK